MNAAPKIEFIEAAKVRVDGLIKWRTHIEKALARSGTLFSYVDVCQLILAGKMSWFENEDSFAVVEPLTYAAGTTLCIILAGGKYEAMLEIEKQIVELGR